jgi:hypothetical protein
MVTREQSQSNPRKRLTVHRGRVGWELREEVGSQVVRTSTCTDWHRVERAMQVFELEFQADRDAPGAAKA